MRLQGRRRARWASRPASLRGNVNVIARDRGSQSRVHGFGRSPIGRLEQDDVIPWVLIDRRIRLAAEPPFIDLEQARLAVRGAGEVTIERSREAVPFGSLATSPPASSPSRRELQHGSRKP